MIKCNNYTKEFENEMYEKASTHTAQQLIDIAKKYGYEMNKARLREYLKRRGLRYKDYNSNYDTFNGLPIYTERTKPDGMVQIKIGANRWVYKSRYVYEQYHNTKLTSDDYIIFLDGNRRNCNINNLYKTNRRVASYVANLRLSNTNIEIIKTAIAYAESTVMIKELENIPTTSHHKKKINFA